MDISKHWVGMPEFIQERVEPYHIITCQIGDQIIKLRFDCSEDLKIFGSRVGIPLSKRDKFLGCLSLEWLADKAEQSITPKTKSLWYPKLDRGAERAGLYYE